MFYTVSRVIACADVESIAATGRTRACTMCGSCHAGMMRNWCCELYRRAVCVSAAVYMLFNVTFCSVRRCRPAVFITAILVDGIFYSKLPTAITNHLPSIIYCHLPSTHHQIITTNHQPPTANYCNSLSRRAADKVPESEGGGVGIDIVPFCATSRCPNSTPCPIPLQP